MKALLIIDVQQIMFTGGPGVYQGDMTLYRIKSLRDQARKSDVPVIFIQHTEPKGELSKGSPGWEIHEKIKPLPGELVVPKGSWDAFLDTILEQELKNRKIDQLIICGMQTEYCVDTTIRGAFARGYRKNVVISDGHTTFDTDNLTGEQIINHHNVIWNGRFARLVKAGDISFSA